MSTSNKRNLTATSPEQLNNNKKRESDKTEIGRMSVAQFQELLTATIADQVKDLATRADVASLTAEIETLKITNSQLNEKLKTMTDRCDILESQLENLSRKQYENCVVVHLPLDRQTSAVDTAKQTCAELLELKEGESFHINKTREITNSNTKRATVFLELHSAQEANKILSASRQLKGSGISIFREQSLIYRKKRQGLHEIKTKLQKINPKEKMSLKGDKLLINNKLYTYNYSSEILIAKTEQDLKYAKQLFGDNTSNFFDSSEGVKLAPLGIENIASTSRLTAAPSSSQHVKLISKKD